jgi:hypothetical protein
MADNKNVSLKEQNEATELRIDIQAAYSFVEAEKFSNALAAFTPEDAMDALIERIEGTADPLRSNDITKTRNIVSKVEAAVARIKALPASTFRRPTNKSVNTRK